MKAVNLIPVERRRGGSGGAGRSGGGAYVLLGGLAALVLMVVLWAVAHQQAANRTAQAAEANSQAAVAQARAGALAGYRQLAELRQRREQAISQLVAGRFDWALAMREVATALPTDVRLLTFTGSVTPGGAASATGSPSAPPAASPAASGPRAGGAGAAPAGASPAGASGAGTTGPSVQLSGCASSQSNVGEILNRLRAIPGVVEVGLGSSEKSGASAPGQSASSTDCAPSQPKFSLVVSFGPQAGAGPAGSAPASPSLRAGTPGQPNGAAPGSPSPSPSAAPAAAATTGTQAPASTRTAGQPTAPGGRP